MMQLSFVVILAAIWHADSRSLEPYYNKETGTIQQCNAEFGCPSGYVCLENQDITGVYMCYPGSQGDQKVTPGSCPHHAKDTTLCIMNKCSFDSDCKPGLKCCRCSNKRREMGTCVTPTPIPQIPTITPLQSGKIVAIPGGGGYHAWASLTLIQSKGKNVIFDTGTVGQRVQMLDKLASVGLSPKDIDFVVTSHGHADHISNGNLFANVPNSFDEFTITDSDFVFNPIDRNETYYILNDTNLQLVFTPGHTLQDTSLVIRNVPNYGTVAAVGDMMFGQNKFAQTDKIAEDLDLLHKSQRNIFCNVDWIIPGHDVMFKVSDSDRQHVKC